MAWSGFRGILVVGCVLSAASAGLAQNWAAAMFETNSHNFGSVARGAKAEYEFVLTNKYAVGRSHFRRAGQLRLHDASD